MKKSSYIELADTNETGLYVITAEWLIPLISNGGFGSGRGGKHGGSGHAKTIDAEKKIKTNTIYNRTERQNNIMVTPC